MFQIRLACPQADLSRMREPDWGLDADRTDDLQAEFEKRCKEKGLM